MRLSYITVGICVILTILVYGCDQEAPTRSDANLPPSASFTVSPPSGGTGTVFNIDASSSSSRLETELLFRWDWEDDGVWDAAFSPEKSVTHIYDSLGYKTIRLEVKDERGISRSTTRDVFITVASKEMILVPAGEFIMGSPEGVGNDDEHPQREVYLDDFFIAKYEVTTEQYVEFLNSIGKNDDDAGHRLVNLDIAPIRFRGQIYKVLKERMGHPVTGVSWYGAKAYAEWIGGRLPTEAEWEKAARGRDGLKWPWGTLWNLANCNTWEGGPHGTTPVGSYPVGASPYGIHDLTGNVYEWLADWYQADYYKISSLRNPKGPESGVFRVLRGGSWAELEGKCGPSVRFGQPPDSADSDFGFRVANDIES